ncbi:MAG: hypothetical protein ACJ8C4_17365 [Gemmataceae bacterium]
MAWVVGIDEAGYGPNLGPMVQSAVAIRVAKPKADLWHILRTVARRAAEDDDGRLAIDDSKAVYQGPGGLNRLEEGVLAAFPSVWAMSLHPWLQCACVTGADDLAAESWFDPTFDLPLVLEADAVQQSINRWTAAVSEAGIQVAPPCCAVTPTQRFNEVVNSHGTKGAATGRGIISLVAAWYARADGEPLHFTIDKLGGRNTYAAMISAALPEGWVHVVTESADLSEYRVEGLKVPVHIVVKPRAESDQMPVALASMLSKYLREVFMRQFNCYWLKLVPDLKPTAGYPGDSRRFYEAIHPMCQQLGMAKDAVWRER